MSWSGGPELPRSQHGNIEVEIQDNLTGLISLRIVAQGHVVN